MIRRVGLSGATRARSVPQLARLGWHCGPCAECWELIRCKPRSAAGLAHQCHGSRQLLSQTRTLLGRASAVPLGRERRERRERGRDQFQRPFNTRDQPAPEANSLTRPLAPETLFHQRPKAPETKSTRDQQFQSTTPTTTHYNTIPHPATKQQRKQHIPQTPQKRTANKHPKTPPLLDTTPALQQVPPLVELAWIVAAPL